MRAALALSCVALAACGGSAAEPPAVPTEPLVDPALWLPTTADNDPFDDRPDDPACSAGAYGVESGVFEVETSYCDYLTATQPLKVALEAGVQISTLVWHLALINETPAEGHVALQIGQHLVFEARPPIPGPERAYPVLWSLPEALPAGTPAYFHVHNHGYNSWRLGPVEAKAPTD